MVIFAVGVGVVSSITAVIIKENKFAVHAEIVEVVVDRSLQEKISEFKNALLDDLRSCESPGDTATTKPIIWDVNNKASIGPYRFQEDTVIFYYKTLYGKEISRIEAVEIALREETARPLASDIIFTHKNGVAKDWVNCSRRYGLDEQLSVIKKLES